MRFKGILTLCLAGIAATASAQTHVEGEEYYKADQFDNAKELLLRSLKNSGTDKAVSNYYLGLIAIRNNNKAEAKQYFDQGIKDNADYAYNYVGLGMLSLLNGNAKENIKEAENYFKQAEKLAKKDPAIHVAIARAYNNADPVAYDKQITKRIEKARKMNIEHPDSYIFEGDRLAAKKEWGDAAAKYEMAANYDDSKSEAFVKYANLFTMVNPQYAIDMLQKLLVVKPESALAQREIATAYYNKKAYNDAVDAYSTYVKNPSHFKQDEDRYAFLLFYSGDFEGGYEFATKQLAKDPKNFTAQRYQFMNAAQIPAMKDQLLGLAENLYSVHKSNPSVNKFAAIDYTLIADELSKAKDAEGNKRTEEAIAVLKDGIANIPENANFNKQLAMVYVDANNLTGAAEAYKGYLAKTEEPGYNDFIQQATFSFYAGVENKENAEKAAACYKEAGEYADKAAAILPNNYKPVMIKGDIAKQTAPADQVETVAQPYYEKALELIAASENPSRYNRDAKILNNYMGNYWLAKKDVAKAKQYFNKYLELDPNNEQYRKFVEGLK